MKQLRLLLQEPVESVTERQQTALDKLILKLRGRVVLFGAGSLGRRTLGALRTIGVEPLCFSDNNPARWGSSVDGCSVLTPPEAAARYGDDTLFIVTIWNAAHWYPETLAQLRSLGCKHISSYSPVHWRFASSFLPNLLNDLPHKVYESAANVIKAEGLWSDEPSVAVYDALITWYATGEASQLPSRPRENSYFPSELFSISSREVLVDCGAFDGDTIRQLLDRAGSAFQAVHAIEADPLSLEKLDEWLRNVTPDIQAKVSVHRCAVGLERNRVRFEVTGTVDSKLCDSGGVEVECIPLDDLLQDTRVTMIKMDIEGAEYDALRGAEHVIRRDHPILAICVYHTQSDIWRIPLLVQSMVPEYSFHLRAYEGDGFQTVMYAIPPDRLLG